MREAQVTSLNKNVCSEAARAQSNELKLLWPSLHLLYGLVVTSSAVAKDEASKLKGELEAIKDRARQLEEQKAATESFLRKS